MQKTFFKRYCDDCLAVHWLEVTPNNKEICHGFEYMPGGGNGKHIRRAAGGGLEEIDKSDYYFSKPIDAGFQMLIDEHNKIS